MSYNFTQWLHHILCCLAQPIVVSVCALALSACSVNSFATKDASKDRELQLAYYDLTPFLGAYYPIASTEFQAIDEPKLSQALQQSGAIVCTNIPCAIDAVVLQSFACYNQTAEQDFILLEIKTPLITLQRLYQRQTQDGSFVLAGPVSVYSPYDNVSPLPHAQIKTYQPYALNQGVPLVHTRQTVPVATSQNRIAPNKSSKQAITDSNTKIGEILNKHSSQSKLSTTTTDEKISLQTPPHTLQEKNKKQLSSTQAQNQVKAMEQTVPENNQQRRFVDYSPKTSPKDELKNKSPAPNDNHEDHSIPQRIQTEQPLQTAQNQGLVENLEYTVSRKDSKLLQDYNKATNIEVSMLSSVSKYESAANDKESVSAQTSEGSKHNVLHETQKADLIEETSLQGQELNTRKLSVGLNDGGITEPVLVEEELVAPPRNLVEDLNARIDLYKKEALEQQQQRELSTRLETIANQAQEPSELNAPTVRDVQSEELKVVSQITPARNSTQNPKTSEQSNNSSYRQPITVNKQSGVTQEKKPSAAQTSDRKVRIIEQLNQYINQNFVQPQEIQQPLLFRLKHSTSQRETSS